LADHVVVLPDGLVGPALGGGDESFAVAGAPFPVSFESLPILPPIDAVSVLLALAELALVDPAFPKIGVLSFTVEQAMLELA
jgi:hypothetical protein